MIQRYREILNNLTVCAELTQAWQDSEPGINGGHEEGGFIIQDSAGIFRVVRWKTGGENSILLPPHVECKIEEKPIIASFHTHPNTGVNYLQEPSETDKRAIRDDPNLKGEFYLGEFVISQAKIYMIDPGGQVNEIGDTITLLKLKIGD
jgi:hypothetical protein